MKRVVVKDAWLRCVCVCVWIAHVAHESRTGPMALVVGYN